MFLAKDPQLDRLVAIKIPRTDTGHNPAALERFAREGRSAAQLWHPGIVSVYNVEHVGTTPFIVSEYVEGMSLGDRLKKDPLFSFRQSAEFLAAVAAAVRVRALTGVFTATSNLPTFSSRPTGRRGCWISASPAANRSTSRLRWCTTSSAHRAT